MTQIPLTQIHPDAIIGKEVEIGPFTFIDKNVEIGDGCIISSNVTILSGSRIGKNCRIFSGAVIGGIPQDLKFAGEESLAIIGDNTTIRECVTVNRGTASKGKTVIGNNCLIMAYSHIAHDCMLGNNIILANITQLGGEVEIEDFAVLGGGTMVHQFSRIGAHAMVQGGTRVTKDIPPYVTAAQEPNRYFGVNAVGIKRRGFTTDQIQQIQNIYRIVFQSKLNTTNAIQKVLEEIPASAEKDQIVAFIQSSPRGIIKGTE
jgi:UDP-N-acetylglucosamine acyltransferase